jgi:hypothetical protein
MRFNMFPKKIDFCLLGATGAAATFYVPVPTRCTIKGMQAACSIDPGDAETITIADGSNSVGVLTFGSDIAAGATGTYAADATYGETIFDAGDVMKITISQLTAAATFCGYIEIDEYARTTQ